MSLRFCTLSMLLAIALPLVLTASAAGDGPVPTTSRLSDPAAERPWRRLSGPIEVAPEGWRKTKQGWQRTDGRPLPDMDPARTINDLIRRQHNLETGGPAAHFLATLMVYLRALDPITVASAQISAICLLAYRVLRRE